MYCYRCNGTLDRKRDVCPKCGSDVRMYKKIVYASNRRYNSALQKAAARNLSGARDDLRASLYLYKKNVPARNLLGLVLYAMGEPAEAIKEWTISRSISSGQSSADRYLSLMKRSARELNSEENGIIKYNQALENAKNGAYDMAIIQLKKVVSEHTNMTKAYDLLGLLYIKTEKYDQAEKTLLRSIEVDRGNDTAVRLLKSLRESQASNTKSRSAGSVGEDDRDPLIIPVRFRDYGTYLSNALYIALGLFLGILIAWFVIIPGRVEKRTEELTAENLRLRQEISALQEQYANKGTDEPGTDESDSEETEPASTEEAAAAPIESMIEYPKNTTWVPNQEDVERAVQDINASPTRYAETVEEILRVDQSQLSSGNQQHYRNVMMILMSEDHYQKMQARAYNYEATHDYENAAIYYDALSRLHPEVAAFRNKAGQNYENAGDEKNAANRYWQTAVLFPDTDQGKDAIYRYVRLTGRADVPPYEGETPVEELTRPLNLDEIFSTIGGV